MTDEASSLPLWLALLTLAEQATHDHLTGLYNRRHFDTVLADQMEIAGRYDRPLSLVLFDLDDFKQVNDRHGHEAGDALLRRFAELLQGTVRKADMVCRYGGDEFAVLLPETSAEQAKKLLERVADGAGSMTEISATAGVASMPCEDLVAAADADLRARKKESR